MDEEKALPDNVIDFDIARIVRGRKRICKCVNPHFELDPTNRIVICSDCGALWDPFNAFMELIKNYERIASFEKRLLEQRRQILNHKPKLIELKRFEQNYDQFCKNGKMVPVCPRCGEAFELQELMHFTNRNNLAPRRNDGESGFE